jgi:RHS repeat-associated protein
LDVNPQAAGLTDYNGWGSSWDRGMLITHYGNQDMTVGWGRSGTDNNGNVLRGHHYIPGGIYVNDYEYDALNRIKKDTGWGNSNYVQAFDYDRFGNRTINQSLTTNVDINKKLFSVNATNNRFTELNYDAAGNVSGEKLNLGNRMEYKYDAENHVVAAGINIVTSGTAPTSRYFYDAAGKRTRKVVSGVETWFVYGIDGELVAEYNANAVVGSPQKEYGYRSGQLLVVYDNTEPLADKKLQWMVADHLGTPRMVIDKTGSLSGIKRHDYLPFGEEIGANVGIRSAGNGYTADQIKQKFTGHQRDVETNLDFMQARYYSNLNGRFTSPDEFNGGPIEAFGAASANPTFYSELTIPQSLNKYQYCYNNPLRYIDPDGHDVEYANDRLKGIVTRISGESKIFATEIQALEKDTSVKVIFLERGLRKNAEGSNGDASISTNPDGTTTVKIYIDSYRTSEATAEHEVGHAQDVRTNREQLIKEAKRSDKLKGGPGEIAHDDRPYEKRANAFRDSVEKEKKQYQKQQKEEQKRQDKERKRQEQEQKKNKPSVAR